MKEFEDKKVNFEILETIKFRSEFRMNSKSRQDRGGFFSIYIPL